MLLYTQVVWDTNCIEGKIVWKIRVFYNKFLQMGIENHQTSLSIGFLFEHFNK